MSHTSRRDFLASSAAAVWLGSDPGSFRSAIQAMRAAVMGGSLQYEVLTLEQAADLEAIAEQIFPGDELPGARDARVIIYIDRALGSHASGQLEAILGGLSDLNDQVANNDDRATRFSELPEATQHAMLREIEGTPFFTIVRNAVVVGMFAHPQWGGNYDWAGYEALGFEPRFLWQPPFGAYDAEAAG